MKDININSISMKGTNEDSSSMNKKSDSSSSTSETTCGSGGRRGGGGGGVRSSLPKPPSPRTPTSQFGHDSMNATHRTIDFDDGLHKSSYHALLDNKKSISSEEYLRQANDKESILPEEGFTLQKTKDIGCSKFVEEDKVLSPPPSTTDFVFCRLECSFSEMVDDVNFSLTNDLYNLKFPDELSEEAWELDFDEAGALRPRQ